MECSLWCKKRCEVGVSKHPKTEIDPFVVVNILGDDGRVSLHFSNLNEVIKFANTAIWRVEEITNRGRM